MAKSPRPDEETIDETQAYLTDVWKGAHADWLDVETYYWRTYAVWSTTALNQARPHFRPAKASSIIDHAVDNHLAFEPKAHRPNFEQTETSQGHADLVETWLGEVMKGASLLEPELTWKQLGKYLLLLGYTVLEGPVLDWSDRPKEPKAEEGESDADLRERQRLYKAETRNWMPFRYRALHPSTILLDPYVKQPREAVKITERTCEEVRLLSLYKAATRKYAQRYDIPSGKTKYDKVKLVELWTPEWHAVKADTGMLYVEANTLGFVPYGHAFSGFGSPRMNDSDPKWLAIGLLHHLRDSIKAHTQRLSAQHELLMRAAYSPLGTNQPPEELAKAIEHGGIAPGQTKDDVWLVPAREVSRWMLEVGGEVLQDIEEGSYARVLAGQRPEGVSTVGQQQILSASSIKKFHQIAKETEQLATVAAQRTLRLVEKIGKDTTVDEFTAGGVSIRPSDVGHNYNVQIAFELIDPVMDLQRQQLGIQLAEGGWIDDETLRANYLRIEDETGVRDRLIKQRLRQHPAVLESQDMAVAKEMGLENILLEWMARQKAEEEAAAAQQGGAQVNPLRQPLAGDVAKPAPAVNGAGMMGP